ncbi:HAD family hydrolase [Pedobacter sp. CFBP9032]|uniref:D-glycero-alpha-D-manno-heptose-1,7-bisphosphate 7-phosphatase n=1 Tax=Pedobacter sp. CFBP9032 TaxID=3096539 RepID=UPI002A6A57C4|nr:HAD family hydrolase [Pedobacter sp. CFBP9032]MDY0904465.1 HAD family hydrolase [Pedobacter sp. CFBP9032]
MVAKRAIFLDKDGTLIPDVSYNVDPDRIVLADGVANGLTQLQEEYLLFVISNQSGVAFGKFEIAALNHVENRLNQLLAAHGVNIIGYYFCPHHPQGHIPEYTKECDCRKPKPGLIFTAADDYQIDLANSWMIGDILNDVEAGKLAGCRSILINNGNETEWLVNGNQNRIPNHICKNFEEATTYILKHEGKIQHVKGIFRSF